MRTDDFSSKLLAGGFTRMRADDLPAAVFVRPGDPVLCVMDLGDASDFRGRGAQVDRMAKAVTSALEKQSGKTVRTLVLAETGDAGADRALTQGESTVWLFGQDGARILFDNQPAEFFGVEKLLASRPDPAAIRESRRRSMSGRSRKTWQKWPLATILLIAVNLAVQIIVSVQQAMSPEGFSVLLSAMDLPVILFAGVRRTGIFPWPAVYRLVTAVFTHYGWRHLLNNMVALAFVGTAAEQLTGRKRYLAAYLISGIGANAVSVLWYLGRKEYNAATAGASGAIFGIIGLLLILALMQRDRGSRRKVRSILFLLAVSAYQGFFTQGVNNTAHISGAAIGALCGLCFSLANQMNQRYV